MHMKTAFSEETKIKMLKGIDILADSVKTTLGPLGGNAAMYQKANLREAEYSDPRKAGARVLVTNDGVTIARGIVLNDPLENMGVRLLRDAAAQTNEAAGDGTTTTIILARGMLREAMAGIAAGANPVQVRKGMHAAERVVRENLRESAVPVLSRAEYVKVASVSCGDPELGEMIGEAFDRVGSEGVIRIDDAGKTEAYLKVQEGIVIDRGFIRPEMATDEAGSCAELHNPYILFCDSKFTDPQDLLPVMIMAAEDDRSLLIISEGVEAEALGLVLANKQQGALEVVCVQAPEYGEGRRLRMEDMAVQTGGVYVSAEKGMAIREVGRDMLGSAEYIKITRRQTVITGGHGDPALIQMRTSELRELIRITDYEFNKKRYEERLAKFVSGVAVLYVGGVTELEQWERKMRAEDAINAVRAAGEAGIVPGGGTALLAALPGLQKLEESLEGDERIGVRAVKNALKAPAAQIAYNAGRNGEAVVERLLRERPGTGYDAEGNRYVDMMAAGIVEPLKAVRTAFSGALSVASTILTTEAAVIPPRGKGGG